MQRQEFSRLATGFLTIVRWGLAPLALAIAAPIDAHGNDDCVRLVPFTAVHLTDAFWASRLETNRRVTLWHDFKHCDENGQLHNFAKAAGLMSGEFRTSPQRDSDIYKVIEGASYILATQPDPKLEKILDNLIAQIAAAQEPDGYLYTARRLLPPEKMPEHSGPKRWLSERSSHELYVSGHLYEAGVAYFAATGKRGLLDVAIKNADLVANDFGPGRIQIPPGHSGIEIGLAKLYRTTSDPKYLALDEYFIDLRGRKDAHKLLGVYCQDHKPIAEQDEALGHAVRAAYLYAGMADVAALADKPGYIKSLDRLWQNVVAKKLSLTGGIGPRKAGEDFGKAYELPNTAYNETCAALANALWNYRMFLLHGDAKYLDVFERVIYNGFLSGVSLSGDSFFYQNPLMSKGGYHRVPWFETPCCPTNIVRFLPTLPGCVYATRNDALYVNLFIAGSGTVKLSGNTIKIAQETGYPWDGHIKITIDPETSSPFRLMVRIPGWACNEPVPSDLYRFADTTDAEPTVRINGEPAKIDLKDGFAQFDRSWKQGDTIDVDLPMPVRRVVGHKAIKDTVGRVALQRGPIVYCAEGVDHKGHALNLIVPDDAKLEAESRSDLLGGVTVIRGVVLAPGNDSERTATPIPFTAIPYYAWAHRGDGEMNVWFARKTNR